MEKLKITDEMIISLKKPLPVEAISQHPTKTYLSTIKAIYVTERLNEVFGIGGWTIQNEVIEKTDKWVVVKGTLVTRDYDLMPIEQYGGNDNADLGDSYKGAATDALTKIASYLGIGMDVYKGLTDPPNGKNINANTSQDNRPWLSEGQFQAMMDSIDSGEGSKVRAAMKKYKIKTTYKDALIKSLNKP